MQAKVSYAQTPHLFRNLGAKKFAAVTATSGAPSVPARPQADSMSGEPSNQEPRAFEPALSRATRAASYTFIAMLITRSRA